MVKWVPTTLLLLIMAKDVVGENGYVRVSALRTFCAIPLQPRDAPPEHATTTTMEEDRSATNLGPEIDEGIVEEPAAVPKQPKRRFVGRKTTEKSGEQPVDPNANIEDSSAIQGVRCPLAGMTLSHS